MNRNIILANTLKKLSTLEPITVDLFIKNLRKIAFTPEKIVPLFKAFNDKYKPKEQDKMMILKHIKKLNLIRIDVPEMITEWKKALKEWGLPRYKIF